MDHSVIQEHAAKGLDAILMLNLSLPFPYFLWIVLLFVLISLYVDFFVFA